MKSTIQPPSGRPIVLIVEDEALLRIVAADVLGDAGFETLEAADADEAVATLEARDDIGIVFTDIDMPGSMNGVRLAETVRERWPRVRVVVTSGKYGAGELPLPAKVAFIPKPYDFSAVAASFRP